MRKESLGKSLTPLCPRRVCDASVICAVRHIGSEFEDLEPSTPGARVPPGNGSDAAKRKYTLDHKFEFRETISAFNSQPRFRLTKKLPPPASASNVSASHPNPCA